MAFTGRLGTEDSRPGNIVLGSEGGTAGPAALTRTAEDAVSTSDILNNTSTGAQHLIRSAVDATTVGDSVASSRTQQDLSDSVVTTDSVGAQVGRVRQPVDTVASSDFVQRKYGVRIWHAGAEAIYEPEHPTGRVEKAGAEVLYLPDRSLRVPNMGAEVLYRPDPAYVEPVIHSITDRIYEGIESFTRTGSDGWGPSEWGPDWEAQDGLPSKFSVNGSRAEFQTAQSGWSGQRVWLPFGPVNDFYIEWGADPLGVGWAGGILTFQLVDTSLRVLAEGYVQVTTSGNINVSVGAPDTISSDGYGFATSTFYYNQFSPQILITQGTIRTRFRFTDGAVVGKMWAPSVHAEPTEWQVYAPLAGFAAEINQDSSGYPGPHYLATSGPTALQVRFNQLQNSGENNLRWWISTLQITGLSSARDEIEHAVEIAQYPGSLADNLTTTDTVAFVKALKRATTDDIRLKDNNNVVLPVNDWIHVKPSEAEMEELGILPGYLLYDFFDRHLPENSLGIASSGWHYPLGGQTTSSTNLPRFIVSDQFGIAQGGIWRQIPTASRIGIRFDMLVPTHGRGHYISYYGETVRQRLAIEISGTGADLGRWLAFNLPATYTASGHQELVFDLNGIHEHWRGQWIRVLAVYPDRSGDIFGLKVWLVDEPEPEDWNQFATETDAYWGAQRPELSLTASLSSTLPPEAERATIVVDNLQLFDPLPYMPGGTTEYYRTTETVSHVHWHHPDDYEATVTDDASTWVPDMVFARVESPQVVAPIENETVLGEDASAGDTEVVVTNPDGALNPDGTLVSGPVFVVIGGVTYPVVGVSPSGALILGQPLSKPYAAGTPVKIRPVPTSITVGGVDITAFVDFKATRLTTYAGPGVGEGEIRIKDVDRTRSITTGAEIIVRHRGIRVWGGYVRQVERSYAFRYGRSDVPAPRFLTIRAADYNILFEARRLFNKVDPLDYKAEPWPVGTSDVTAVQYMIQNYLDLTGDNLGFDIQVSQTIAPYEEFTPSHADGTKWMEAMNVIIDRTRAVFYIDPDKVMRYVDDSTQQSRFGYDGLSDAPDGVSTIGYREFELDNDGTKMINDAMVWGYGPGSPEMAFWRESDATSLAAHGRWQHGEVRGDMYKPESVKRRAQTWVHGSAYNRRGHKDDKLSVRCVVFVPYFRVGDVVQVENTSFGFSDLIPVRAAVITFPTPFDIRVQLTISHELDPPWNTFEWMPLPPFEPLEGPPIKCPTDIVPQYEPFGPNVAYVVPALPAHESGWLVYQRGRMVGAKLWSDGTRSWVWSAEPDGYGGQAYKGHILDPAFDHSYTHTTQPPEYRYDPILHSISEVPSGYMRYSFGSVWAHYDFASVTLETRSWQRIAVEDPGWSGELEVTLRLDWEIEAWNAWSKYWLGGIGHTYRLPLGAAELSFNDAHQDGDWPDPFHIEGMRDIPDLIDMTSDMINGEDHYNSYGHGTTKASGSTTVKRIMRSGGSVQMSALYSGALPHEAVHIEGNDWAPSGGFVYLTGQWHVVGVRRVNTTLLVRDLQDRDDGTHCVSIPGSGEVTLPLQKTNHPSGVVYRFAGAYIEGTTRVFIDGLLIRRGVDYFESDPSAGYITLAEPTDGLVTGAFWIKGASVADLSGLSLVYPTSGPITGTFGPQSSGWSAYSWHGVYYEHFHNGVDFGVPGGTPVYASAPGVAYHETQSAGGTMIHIYHADNVRTTYAHLAARSVGHGTSVSQGQLIGYSGDSGIVTGAHLHWGLTVNGIPENPMELV